MIRVLVSDLGNVVLPLDPLRACVGLQHGLEKPDPEFFRIAMRAAGEPPEAYLFIDDLPANVEGARAVGMDAVLFQGAGHLREALASRGLLESAG